MIEIYYMISSRSTGWAVETEPKTFRLGVEHVSHKEWLAQPRPGAEVLQKVVLISSFLPGAAIGILDIKEACFLSI